MFHVTVIISRLPTRREFPRKCRFRIWSRPRFLHRLTLFQVVHTTDSSLILQIILCRSCRFFFHLHRPHAAPLPAGANLENKEMARASIRDDFANPFSSPETSISDKENRQQFTRKRGSTQNMASRSASNKRPRLANRPSNIQSGTQIPLSQTNPEKQYYDPDQDETERRWIRKGLRDLTRDLHGKRLIL